MDRCAQSTAANYECGAVPVQISNSGSLTVQGQSVDLTKPGTSVSLTKAKRPRLFCVRLVSSDPPRQFVFDTGSAEEQQRWLAAMQRFAPVAAQEEGAFRQYAFALSLCGVEALQFAVRHR